MVSARTVWFLTHPEVHVDPSTPVEEWGLSDVGRARAGALRDGPWLEHVSSVWSSTETKAVETADLIAGNRPRRTHPGLGENDRSATGFLPPAEFETVADAFFAHPEMSARGWARAVDEQARIVAAVDDVLADARSGSGDVVVVAHGAVGTLLRCHLTGSPISRAHDQPGQGHWFTFDRDSRQVHEAAWRPLEDLLARR